ncbi:hypothetical protein B0T16DRAFT_99228 [Cercophora newfieldiana]|uniref:Uncharacterized protein n=1 Tax=Cercophora newfieldiana TaxID=92897 RepID=A0AA39YGL3_9PEZI|nr:hypothetical protein B0T16DRAFT_99228 [Cercophora newfieldiana]
MCFLRRLSAVHTTLQWLSNVTRAATTEAGTTHRADRTVQKGKERPTSGQTRVKTELPHSYLSLFSTCHLPHQQYQDTDLQLVRARSAALVDTVNGMSGSTLSFFVEPSWYPSPTLSNEGLSTF